MVVQIARHVVQAKKIIGIAGSDEKCRWVESLGADKCKSDFSKLLKSMLLSARAKNGKVSTTNLPRFVKI